MGEVHYEHWFVLGVNKWHLGVIKGSEPTLHSSDGFLDKNEYIGLSHRSQGTFATQRDAVYSLFQSYLKQKAMRRDYDAADRWDHCYQDNGKLMMNVGKQDSYNPSRSWRNRCAWTPSRLHVCGVVWQQKS